MLVHFIEASNDCNYGKFMLLQYGPAEWAYKARLSGVDSSLLMQCGWLTPGIWVCDLQTGEGAYFKPGGVAKNDLAKHAVWVCVLFEPFLAWLYDQQPTDIRLLPSEVHLPSAPGGWYGHRRAGPSVEQRAACAAAGELPQVADEQGKSAGEPLSIAVAQAPLRG